MDELCPMPGCRVEAITPGGPNLLHVAVHVTWPVHSRYQRKPADLPSFGRRVGVSPRVRRFYCDGS